MEDILKFFIGIIALVLAFPLGNYLAKLTKEELSQGKKWFNLIIVVCLVGALVSIFFRNDYLLFSFLFIAIITSRSLRRKKKKRIR